MTEKDLKKLPPVFSCKLPVIMDEVFYTIFNKKELLEKIKPGTKPSDLKKQRGNISKKTDEGYSSDEGKNFADKADNQKIDNSKKNNFAVVEKKLLDQITSLKKQLQTYKDFKEADLKIKEKYK